MKEREERFRGERPPLQVANRTVIVVDDGLATGATMRATLRALRMLQPAARLVAAAPVGPPDTCQELQQDADEVVVVSIRASFSSVVSTTTTSALRPMRPCSTLQEFDTGAHRLPTRPPCRDGD